MAKKKYRARMLRCEEIVKTVAQLHARIEERFPDSGLSHLCADLLESARATASRVERLARPYFGLRLLAALALIPGIGGQLYLAGLIDWHGIVARADTVAAAEGVGAAVNLFVLFLAALVLVPALERRMRRRRVLRQLHEFRSLAHVIDMHQLTRDPATVLGGGSSSSSERRMSEFRLSHYLEYCTKMLAIVSKLAVLYAGRLQDPDVIRGVNEIEALSADLGRKIWQKIAIVSRIDEHNAGIEVERSRQPWRPNLAPSPAFAVQAPQRVLKPLSPRRAHRSAAGLTLHGREVAGSLPAAPRPQGFAWRSPEQ